MKVNVMTHPLIQHKVTLMRDVEQALKISDNYLMKLRC